MGRLPYSSITILATTREIWQVGDGGHLEGNNQLVLNCATYTCFCGKRAGTYFTHGLKLSLRPHFLENSLINYERLLNRCKDAVTPVMPIRVLSMNFYRNFKRVASLLWVRENQILYLLFLSCSIFHPSILSKIHLNLPIVKGPTFVLLDSS